MQIDSDIISFTANSLYSDSSFTKNSNNGSADSIYAESPHQSETRRTFCQTLRQELRSFCCILCFFTCKSFKFHSINVFVILLSLQSVFTQMILGGYMSAILSSLQTQYNLSTTKIGYILSSFDIVSVFAVPIVSYIGSRYNKAKVISICGFIWSVGGCVFTVPYFFSSKYVVTNAVSFIVNGSNGSIIDVYSGYDICKPVMSSTLRHTTTSNIVMSYSQEDSNTSDYDVSTMSYLSGLSSTTSANSSNGNLCERSLEYTWPYYVFIAAQFLMSLGYAPQFSLGITYLCDNLDESVHAFYTGEHIYRNLKD